MRFFAALMTPLAYDSGVGRRQKNGEVGALFTTARDRYAAAAVAYK